MFYFWGWISVFFLFVSPGQRFQIAGFSFVGLNQRQCVVTVKGQESGFSGCTFSVKGSGKVHPCTGTEALYRPYGL